jgi:hypothetical protein
MHGISYVIPIRCDGECAGHPGLAANLRQLADAGVEVVVVDGSSGAAEDAHRATFRGLRQVMVAIDPGINGKVRAVDAGMAAAIHELVVIADEDVRYDPRALARLTDRLEGADIVVPQNYFIGPTRWHTHWDSSRSLLNRTFGHDYPGTLALRRSMYAHMGGYDETALFENLELIRTVEAAGGRVRWAPEIFVPRAGPTTSAFVRQRVRQAYDDLGQPSRLARELLWLPMIVWGLARHRRALAVGVGAIVALAEFGRRRGGGREFFPWKASLAAPCWVAERACCVWVAMWLRVVKGGVLYRGSRLRKAASSPRELRRRYAGLGPNERVARAGAGDSLSDGGGSTQTSVVRVPTFSGTYRRPS